MLACQLCHLVHVISSIHAALRRCEWIMRASCGRDSPALQGSAGDCLNSGTVCPRQVRSRAAPCAGKALRARSRARAPPSRHCPRPGQRAGDGSAFGALEPARARIAIEQVICGQRVEPARYRQPETAPCGACRADHDVVVIHRQQRGRAVAASAAIRHHDAPPVKGGTKRRRLYLMRSLRDDGGDQAVETLGLVGPRRGDVQRRDQRPVRPVYGRIHAAHADIARQEMLVAVNGHLPVLRKAGADPVGAFRRLAPVGPSPKPPTLEHLRIAIRTALLKHDALGIGQQHPAARMADQPEQAVETRRRDAKEGTKRLAAMPELARLDALPALRARGVQPVGARRALPGRRQTRMRCRRTRGQGVKHPVDMLRGVRDGLLPSANALRPASPRPVRTAPGGLPAD